MSQLGEAFPHSARRLKQWFGSDKERALSQEHFVAAIGVYNRPAKTFVLFCRQRTEGTMKCKRAIATATKKGPLFAFQAAWLDLSIAVFAIKGLLVLSNVSLSPCSITESYRHLLFREIHQQAVMPDGTAS